MMTIGFIVEVFPSATETFVYRELEEALERGVDLRVYALRADRRATAGRLGARVRYAPRALALSTLASHFHFLRRRPGRCVTALWRLLAANALSPRGLVSALRHYPAAVGIARQMADDGVGYVHAHFANLPATVAYVAARLLSVRFGFTAHARDLYVAPRMLAEKIRAADVVIACNDFNQRLLRRSAREGDGDKVHRVYHGVDVDRFARTRARPSSGGAPTIVSVGRLEEKKGHADLVAACAVLARDGFDHRCVIAGAGREEASLRAAIEASGLGDAVHLAGALDEAAVIDLYDRADLFVLPCVTARDGDHDGLPNVLIEALAMELPVITTGVGAIPELVCDGETGVVVPVRDADALAAAIRSLWADAPRRERLARNGRAAVVERFQTRRNVARLIELWQSAGVIASNERGASSR